MAKNETIKNIVEEGVETVMEAAEAIPVKADNKFGVIGAVVLVGGIAITGVAMGIRYIKNKKKAKEEQADDDFVDNVQVAKNDFLDN